MPRPFNREKTSFFQQLVLGQLDTHMQKNKVKALLYIVYEKYILCSEIGRLTIIKMAINPQTNTDLMQLISKFQ